LRIFISFSHTDDALYAELYFLLAEQGHSPFTYQAWGRELPPGTDHVDRIRQEIESSELFIALITCRSLKSEWVACEVELAYELSKMNALRAIAIVDRQLSDSPPAFSSLRHPNADIFLKRLVYLRIDTTKLSAAVEDLFRRLGLEYAPNDDWRSTDLGEYFLRARNEIPNLTYQDPEHAISTIAQSIKYLDQSKSCFEQTQNEEAKELALTLDRLLVDATSKKQGSYNVALILSSLMIRFEDSQSESFNRVANILIRVKEHPFADEVVFQSLGFLEMCSGNVGAALTLYQRAYTINGDEPDAVHGLALSHLYIGSAVPPEVLAKLLAHCETRLESVGVLMLAYASENKWLEMQQLLRTVLEAFLDHKNFDSLISAIVVAALESKKAVGLELAASWLFNASQSYKNTPMEKRILAAIGLIAARKHDLHTALECFARLVDIAPNTVEHLGRYLQLLNATQDENRGKQIAAKILAISNLEPSSSDHFYYRGMAFWTLGLRNEAEKDFKSSRLPIEFRYGQ